MFHRLFVTGLGLLLVPALAHAGDPPAGGAPAGDSTEVVEILKKADAAAKAVKGAKYEVKFEGVGDDAAKVPMVEGAWLTVDFSDGRAKKYRIDAKVTAPGSKDVQKVTIGSDGENYYLLDHNAKKAYVDVDPNVIGRVGRALFQATLAELGHPKPFSDEIDGKVKELKGSKTINGEDCHEIFVTYANAPQDAIWWISKKDFLPRARQDIIKRGETTVSSMKTIAKLEVDPKTAADAFKLVIPEGYEKTDDFAP